MIHEMQFYAESAEDISLWVNCAIELGRKNDHVITSVAVKPILMTTVGHTYRFSIRVLMNHIKTVEAQMKAIHEVDDIPF